MMVPSPRLRYEPLAPDHLDDFHALVQDAHIRRYLMDGELMPREWSDARIRDSQMLAGCRRVGLSLVFERTTAQLVGFCGFLVIPSISAEPQLVYALHERFTGLGYATEMARAAIDDARAAGGFDEVTAGVDAVNAASIRVLEKLGFERTGMIQGAFGEMFSYRLRL